jgi:catechol 2,3-dioxygenase-like lactoylglutathione lyase family enzyme
MKITPVLLVNEIEKSLPFWVDRLGFTKTVEVPEGSRLGFVILAKDGGELMLQTWDSAQKDGPDLLPKDRRAFTALFIEVGDFADILKRLQGWPITLAERTTFYGMREIGVHDPDNNAVVFATRIK